MSVCKHSSVDDDNELKLFQLLALLHYFGVWVVRKEEAGSVAKDHEAE